MTDKIPNPGSHAAVDTGCLCPVMDNANGAGVSIGGQTMHWISSQCPLHGSRVDDNNARETLKAADNA